VSLRAEAAASIRAAWQAARTAEPCGYLLGRRGGGCVLVASAPAGTNVHPRPAGAFRLDPDEHLAVCRRARRAGLAVVGLWHGHRIGPARPSRADRAGARPPAPGLMLVAGRCAQDGPRLAAFARTQGLGWRACDLEISAPTRPSPA
jgi:proteasome lid subunit RPN8/RPN11